MRVLWNQFLFRIPLEVVYGKQVTYVSGTGMNELGIRRILVSLLKIISSLMGGLGSGTESLGNGLKQHVMKLTVMICCTVTLVVTVWRL